MNENCYSLESFVVLWSPAQRSFHVSTLAEMLADNARAFAEGAPAAFVTLAITNDRRQAAAIFEKLSAARDAE